MSISTQEFVSISRNVAKELNIFFDEFCTHYLEFNAIRDEYSKKKVHLNGVQFYTGFVSGDTKEWQQHIEVSVAIELVMLWAYKTNRILDKKQDAWTDTESIQNTVLEHDLMLSCILKLLEQYDSKHLGNSQKVRSILDELISSMVYGFWVERKYLMVRYSKLENILENWEHWYRERNVHFNLVYDYATLVGYSLSCNDFSIFDTYVSKFDRYKRFSNLGQTINDLGDFGIDVDSHVKGYQDIFSDIRNGIVTYPVHAMIGERLIKKALKHPRVTRSKFWQWRVRGLISKHNLHASVLDEACDSYFAQKEFFEQKISDTELIMKGYRMLVNNKYFDQEVVARESKFLRSRVILCDIRGNENGTCDKVQAHKEGLLHKAFSVFIFDNDGKLLIQKRAQGKYHSGGLWANSCCSHYMSGEQVLQTANKRLQEEMGFTCDSLKKKFSFVYNLDCGDGMYEHEFDTVIYGTFEKNSVIVPNIDEVSEYQWVKMDDLVKEIEKSPSSFAPWFKKILVRIGALSKDVT